jgi:polyisoprenyl-teichoic acid--peptidoglycan teichoic acid transferase
MRLYNNKYFIYVLLPVVFVVSTLTSYFYYHFSKVVVSTDKSYLQADTESNFFLEDMDDDNSFAVVLLGYGGAGHDGGYLSDTLMVVYVNPEIKRAALITVPRDLWVEIPVRSDAKESHKINTAYAIGMDDRKYPLKENYYKGDTGGGQMAKQVVGNAIGLPVKYFASVSFDGFSGLIDKLDGVNVDVPVYFEDRYYPVKGLENETCGKTSEEIAELHRKYSDTALHKQFECRYEVLRFEKGIQKMDGETALKFVRSRNSAQHGGDFARSIRQQSLLFGIKDKLITLDAVSKVDSLFNQFSGSVRADLDIKTTRELLNLTGKPQDYEIGRINLSTENVLVDGNIRGQSVLLPKEGAGNWNKVHEFVRAGIGM